MTDNATAPAKVKPSTLDRVVTNLPPILGVIGGVVVCALDTVYNRTETYGLLAGLLMAGLSLLFWQRSNTYED